MKIKYLKAQYKKEFTLPNRVEKSLKENFKEGSTIAVYTAIQFLPHLNKIKEILEKNNYKFITSKPKRAEEIGQILGCDSYSDSLNLEQNVNGYIYIGDGYFHPCFIKESIIWCTKSIQ